MSVDKAAGVFNLVGIASENSTGYFFTATRLNGQEYVSKNYPITVSKKSGKKSHGGCDTGFAGLALFLAAPLFLRKKG